MGFNFVNFLGEPVEVEREVVMAVGVIGIELQGEAKEVGGSPVVMQHVREGPAKLMVARSYEPGKPLVGGIGQPSAAEKFVVQPFQLVTK